MRICFGWSKTPIKLSSERRYMPEEIHSMLISSPSLRSTNPLVNVPLWIEIDGEYLRLSGEDQISLACQIVSVYHNGPDCLAPSDDGWDLETAEMEAKAAQHMTDEDSDEGSEVEVVE
jgi:hypothetical protein